MNIHSIRSKLLFCLSSVFVLIACLVVVFVFVLGGLSTAEQEKSVRSDRYFQIYFEMKEAQVDFRNQIQEWSYMLLRASDPEQLTAHLELFTAAEARVQGRLVRVRELLQAEELGVSDVDRLIELHLDLGVDYRKALESYDPEAADGYRVVDEAVRGLDQEPSDSMNRVVAYSETLRLLTIENDTLRFQGIMLLAQRSAVAAGIAAAVLLAGMFFVLYRAIIKPLRALSLFSRAVAARDLTQRLAYRKRDEIGELSVHLDSLSTAFDSIILGIKDTASDVRDLSAHLAASAEESSVSLEETARTMNAIRDKIAVLDEEIRKAARLADEVEAFIGQVTGQVLSQSASVQEASASMEQMSASVKQVKATVDSRMAGVDQLASAAGSGEEEMRATVESIRKVNEATNLMAELLGVINGIASRTNLLAMNAAIEAAHAGAAGKGFAVVADEIRKLAEHTTVNSKNIGRSLKEMTTYMNDSGKSVENMVGRFGFILDGVRQMSQGMLEVQHAVTELSAGGTQINAAIGAILSSGDALDDSGKRMKTRAEDLKRSLETIHALSSDAAGGAAEVNQGLDDVNRAVAGVSSQGEQNLSKMQELEKLISVFRTSRDVEPAVQESEDPDNPA